MPDGAATLPCVEIEPEASARWSVIWLHGLGADGNDFVPIVPELGLAGAGVRFVFPHAPSIPVTVNGGFVMPAWYDVHGLTRESPQDEEGILRSSGALTRLIERERTRGTPCERILLAGFSQGGAIAAHVALRHPEPLAGLVALSTYLVRDGALEVERSEANRTLPVFQAHGLFDPMVAPELGTASRDRLLALGHPVEWHAYPMQHQVCAEEIQDLSAWLRERGLSP